MRFKAFTIEKIMNNMNSILHAVDMQTYDVLFANKKCESVFGDVVGKKCYEVFQEKKTKPCHDITEIEKIREQLKNDLNISNENFQDAFQLAREYEKAIDESTIVTRTDLEGNITYANDNFYKTTVL